MLDIVSAHAYIKAVRLDNEEETATSYPTSAPLVINEVMQSNIDYLMVGNDFPDSWVELYNPAVTVINIKKLAYRSDKRAQLRLLHTS